MQKDVLSRYMMDLFGEAARMEEIAVAGAGFRNLSVSEVHVIHAVCEIENSQEVCTPGRLAQRLRMKPENAASMTAALEQKGYFIRRRDETQQLHISTTAKGRRAYQCHLSFHRDMTEKLLDAMSEEEGAVLIRALAGMPDCLRG